MSTSAQRWTVVAAMSVVALSVVVLWAAHGVHAQSVPAPSHVIVIMEENHGYSEIIGSSQAPYINSLASDGALFTNSHAITHPSEPNYMAIFSGSTDGLTADTCPVTSSAVNLGSELLAAGKTFTGYAESLPSSGSTACTAGAIDSSGSPVYARKHAPWINFTNVPGSDSKPFSSFPSSSFASLPTVAFVIPNLMDDMHDGTIAEADSWLSKNIASYISWAKSNNSLLIITWDEDQYESGESDSSNNQIPTIFVGPMVKNGKYSEKISHYNVLRTIEDMYGLPHAGSSSSVTTITDVWQ